jgi:hypothetical protein
MDQKDVMKELWLLEDKLDFIAVQLSSMLSKDSVINHENLDAHIREARKAILKAKSDTQELIHYVE